MNRLLVIGLLIGAISNISGQTPDTDKLKGWAMDFRIYFYSDTTKSLAYLDSIKTQLLDKTDTAHYWRGIYLGNMAYRHSKAFNHDWVLDKLYRAKRAFRAVENRTEIAKINLRIGSAYINKRVYDSALFYATKAYEQTQELGVDHLINRSLGDLFVIYFYLEEYEKSLGYVRKYVSNLVRLQDTVMIPRAYMNLAATYFRLENFDSSVYYHRKSLKWALSKGMDDDIAYSYLNLGEVHSTLFDVDSAIYYHKKAQELFERNGNPAGLTSNSLNLGKAYIKRKKLDSAVFYINESIRLASNNNDMALLRDAYDVLVEVSQSQSDYQLAFYTLRARNKIQDSLSNVLKQNQIDEIITKYETREKEQQIQVQQAELAEKEAQLERNQVLLIALAIVALLIAGLWLVNRNRLKKKQQLAIRDEQLKTSEAEMKATISSQENERSRYARDLHDGFGQMISILNLNLQNLGTTANPDERQAAFMESEKLLNQMYDELKNICFDMMPQTLINAGITSALDEFAKRINKANKVYIETNFFGFDERLSELQEISIYRICQEWINNTLKYSDAQKITIQLTRDEGEITLLIEDDGAGFDLSLLKDGKGNGWKNIQSRSNLIKGVLEVETSVERQGSTLILNAPVSKEKVEENTIETV